LSRTDAADLRQPAWIRPTADDTGPGTLAAHVNATSPWLWTCIGLLGAMLLFCPA
jgi:hypothetical protein